MQTYLEKFNQLYKGKQSIDIEFFNEEPLTIKYTRYNQSGEVCSSPADSDVANLKVKNGWHKIKCNTYDCQYRQKNEQGKCACNRIGWLKFIITSVCKDRIFLMKITGQTSINRLNDYFNLQKIQGNSIKGKYKLVLKQEEQINILGQTFNNYILDVLKQEDSETKQIPKPTENIKDLSTENEQKVNNDVAKDEITPIKEENINNIANDNKEKEAKQTATKKTSKKETKSKTKTEETMPKESKVENAKDDNNFENCYVLLSTVKETIANKEYLVAEVADMQDKISNVIIRPEEAIELEKCNLGTVVKLDISEVKGRKFAIKLEFIEKTLKKEVA